MDSKEYTRVTSVLEPFSGVLSIPKPILDKAAEFGTSVHHRIEGQMKGFTDAACSDEHVDLCMSSFMQWCDHDKAHVVPDRFYCDTLNLTGAVDCLKEDGIKGWILIDFKTSSKPHHKIWQLQGSAYMYLARIAGIRMHHMQFVHLKKDGTQPDVYEYEENWEQFLKCLELYRYFGLKDKKEPDDLFRL